MKYFLVQLHRNACEGWRWEVEVVSHTFNILHAIKLRLFQYFFRIIKICKIRKVWNFVKISVELRSIIKSTKNVKLTLIIYSNSLKSKSMFYFCILKFMPASSLKIFDFSRLFHDKIWLICHGNENARNICCLCGMRRNLKFKAISRTLNIYLRKLSRHFSLLSMRLSSWRLSWSYLSIVTREEKSAQNKNNNERSAGWKKKC